MCDATRSTERDFCRLQRIVHHFRFLRLAASTSKLTCRSFSFFLADSFLPSANQLFLVYGDASGRICLLPRGQEAFLQRMSSPRERGGHVLRVALGDNESRFAFTPETWRSSWRGSAPCLFSHHRRKRSSGAQAEEAWDSGPELVTRTCTYVANRPTHTRGLGDSSALARTFFWQWGYRYQSYCFLLLKSKGWHTDLRVKMFNKKKTDRPPVKIWAMLVKAETFFCFA